MELKIIEHDFSVCKVEDFSAVNMEDSFVFMAKTDEEHSLVCRTESVPKNTIAREDGWKAFKIQGILDFSLIGILSKISAVLSENKIGIFVVSTYNTDYIMVKSTDVEKASDVLENSGYIIS